MLTTQDGPVGWSLLGEGPGEEGETVLSTSGPGLTSGHIPTGTPCREACVSEASPETQNQEDTWIHILLRERQTRRETDRHGERQTQRDRHRERQTQRETDRHGETDTERDRWTWGDRHGERQTQREDTEKDRRTGRETDMERDRYGERQTRRDRHTERQRWVSIWRGRVAGPGSVWLAGLNCVGWAGRQETRGRGLLLHLESKTGSSFGQQGWKLRHNVL